MFVDMYEFLHDGGGNRGKYKLYGSRTKGRKTVLSCCRTRERHCREGTP